ncbi:hypothetical protein, partial [Stenotrophomonas sp. YIM B06876]|uniref:hypothetical protein n=1 Tax=Stenotrophomonas sp. YIM B06876 TaxID=3060211 RepID=UPI002739CD80
ELLRTPAPQAAQPLLAEVQRLLHALVQPLRAWGAWPLDSKPAAGQAPPFDLAGQACVRQLQELLQQDDARALAYLKQNVAMLRAALGPAMHSLQRHIEDFDFEPALALLQAWRPGPGCGSPRQPTAGSIDVL